MLKHRPLALRPSTEDCIYLAGYFDGEGSIIASSRTRMRHSLSVQVSTGDKECVELFAKYFGGNVYLDKPKPGRNRQIYRWALAGWYAQRCLFHLLPYLHSEKKNQALLAMLFTFHFTRYEPITEKEMILREVLCSRIKAINQRITIPAISLSLET